MTTKTLDHTLLKRLSLIGRDKELGQIEETAKEVRKSRQPAVLYIEGEGGIGKTALLEEARRRLSKRWGSLSVAEDIIDLYHLQYQTPQGFAKEVIRLLGEQAHPYFAEYHKKIEKLNQQISAGGVVTEEERKEVWESFTKALSGYAKGQAKTGPTVLFLDTIEVLGITRDDFQQEMRDLLASNLSISMLNDLITHFSDLQGPILWVVAGRPRKEIHSQLQQIAPYERIQLGPLNDEDARHYLNTIAEQLEGEAQEKLCYALEEAGDRLIRGAGGRPIMLTLIAYIAAAGLSFPEDFGEKEQDQWAVEETILRLFVEIPEWGETLRLMGLLREGLDFELLQKLKNLDESNAREQLAKIEDLVIIKAHSVADADGQEHKVYFLHDEIYAMFDRHLHYLPPSADRKRYIKQLTKFYTGKEKEIIWKARHKVERRAALKLLRHRLQAETLHYQLLDNPYKGFSEFFRDAEDALDAREQELFLMLRNELLRAQQILKVRAESEPEEYDPSVVEELSTWIRYDLAIRWGIFRMLINNNLQAAFDIFQRIKTWQPDVFRELPLWLRLHLQLYESVYTLKKLSSSKEQASERLQKIYQKIEKLLRKFQAHQNDSRHLQPILQTLMAYTAAYLGYSERLQGQYSQAIQHYKRAARYFRALRLAALTTTLSNQAYAMALVGRLSEARDVIKEAEQRARQYNNDYQYARVLNVRCFVESYDGHLSTAQQKAEEALQVLQNVSTGIKEVQQLRATIYAYRAQTRRFLWNRYVTDDKWQEADKWRESLWKAHEDAVQAVELYPHPEQKKQRIDIYYLEIKNIAGCIWREMAWLYRKWQQLGIPELSIPDCTCRIEDFENAKDKAEETLREVAGIPPEHTNISQWKDFVDNRALYYPALALIDLGWHWFYQKNPAEQILQLCDLVSNDLVPEAYHLPTPAIERDKAEILLWGILSKAEMLRFRVGLGSWKQLTTDEIQRRLKENIRYAINAFEYASLIGEKSANLRRVQASFRHLTIQMEEAWEEDESDLFAVLARCSQPYLSRLKEHLKPQRSPAFERWLLSYVDDIDIDIDEERENDYR